MQKFVITVFGLAAGICFLLSLYLGIRTDRNLPYIKARIKSTRRAFLFMALTFIFGYIAAGINQHYRFEEVFISIIAILLFLGVCYGITYLQIITIGKNETVRKFFYSDKDDNVKK